MSLLHRVELGEHWESLGDTQLWVCNHTGVSMSSKFGVAPAAPEPESAPVPRGAGRVLTLSTIAFTLMFATWLMFGVLGIPIRDEFGLTDVELSWLSAVAILNGALWRLPAGILADRYGGRVVFTVLLLATAVFSYLVALAD